MIAKLPVLPQTRWISDPGEYPPLQDFRCGGESEYERDVEEALDQLRALSTVDAGEFAIRVAEARHTEGLVAVSVFHERPFTDDEAFTGAVCLDLTVIGEPYRGLRMPDGATRIGTFMLCDTLAQIHQGSSEGMPYVWGAVHRDNQACQRILSRHHFWRLRARRSPTEPYYIHLRDRGLNWDYDFSPQILEMVEGASL